MIPPTLRSLARLHGRDSTRQLAAVVHGAQRYQDSVNGGDTILTTIKQLAEAEAARSVPA
jgi:hypothetical protein